MRDCPNPPSLPLRPPKLAEFARSNIREASWSAAALAGRKMIWQNFPVFNIPSAFAFSRLFVAIHFLAD